MALPGTDKGNRTKGTRQIPLGYGWAPVTALVRHRREERGQGAAGSQTHGKGKEAIYKQKEIAGEKHILAPPQKRHLFASGDVLQVGMKRETEQ